MKKIIPTSEEATAAVIVLKLRTLLADNENNLLNILYLKAYRPWFPIGTKEYGDALVKEGLLEVRKDGEYHVYDMPEDVRAVVKASLIFLPDGTFDVAPPSDIVVSCPAHREETP